MVIPYTKEKEISRVKLVSSESSPAELEPQVTPSKGESENIFGSNPNVETRNTKQNRML